MTTARSIHSITHGLRAIALAGTLTIMSLGQGATAVFADAGDVAPTSTPVLTQDEAFDVAPGTELEGLTARVVAGPEGAPLLESASLTAPVLEQVPDGTQVSLRVDMVDTVIAEDGQTRLWPVAVGGTSGWINGRSLVADAGTARTASEDATVATTSTRVPFDYTGDVVGAQAEVSADGEGLAMRAEPAADAEVVVSIPEGTVIDLRIDSVDTVYDAAGTRWWPVTYNGVDGWVSGLYLVTPGTTPVVTDTVTVTTVPASNTVAATPTPATATTTTPAADSAYTYQVGDWAVIRTADQQPTNAYAEANNASSVAGEMPHMALVEVLAQGPGNWYQVRWDTITGYVPAELLTAGSAPQRVSDTTPVPTATSAPASTATATAAATTTDLAVGEQASIDTDSNAGANLRQSAGADADIAGFLAENSEVTIEEGPNADASGQNWFRVTDGSADGWVRADLLSAGAAAAPTTTAPTQAESSNGFILPLTGYRFTQDYGCSSLGFYSFDANWGCSVHDGVDLAAPAGTALVAVANGTVVQAGWSSYGLGYYVEIDHGNGVHTIYGHMIDQPIVSAGQQVTQGQQIGSVGSTGLSTGPHVHFMVRLDGVTQDPKNYLPALN